MQLGLRASGWGLVVVALVGGWLLVAGTIDAVEVARSTSQRRVRMRSLPCADYDGRFLTP